MPAGALMRHVQFVLIDWHDAGCGDEMSQLTASSPSFQDK